MELGEEVGAGGRDLDLLIVSNRRLFLELLSGAFWARTPTWRIQTTSTTPCVADEELSRRWDAVMIEIGLVEEISSGPSLAIRDLRTRGRVLAITAIPDPSHIGVLLGAGAHAVLTMQNSMSDVLDAIDATVGGRAVHDAAAVAAYRDAARARILEGAERRRRLASLTTSERMVLDLLRAGQTAAEIAANRHVAVTTVRGHIRAVLCKLGVNSQLGAVVYAIGQVGDQTS